VTHQRTEGPADRSGDGRTSLSLWQEGRETIKWWIMGLVAATLGTLGTLAHFRHFSFCLLCRAIALAKTGVLCHPSSAICPLAFPSFHYSLNPLLLFASFRIMRSQFLALVGVSRLCFQLVQVIRILVIGIYFVLRPAPARHDRHVVELHTSKGSCSDNAILHAGSGPGISPAPPKRIRVGGCFGFGSGYAAC
jgi:hypothetical protein